MFRNDLRWEHADRYGRKQMVRLKFDDLLEKRIFVKFSLGAISLLLFLLSVVFLILLTLFESSLAGLSISAEKWISGLGLVIPALIGAVFGMLSITRKEPKVWIGILGTLLNGLFALFHLFLLSFAG
jgi:hypothetical protein